MKRARRSPKGAGRRVAARSRLVQNSGSVAVGVSCGGSKPSTRAILPNSQRFAPLSARVRSSCSRGSDADGRVERRPGDAAEDGDWREAFGEETTPVYLFGAGHVGRALVMALAPLPFAVRWIDPRPEAFPERAPAQRQVCLRSRPAR